jgi:hypothetical protein
MSQLHWFFANVLMVPDRKAASQEMPSVKPLKQNRTLVVQCTLTLCKVVKYYPSGTYFSLRVSIWTREPARVSSAATPRSQPS